MNGIAKFFDFVLLAGWCDVTPARPFYFVKTRFQVAYKLREWSYKCIQVTY